MVSAAQAAQAQETARFAASQRAAQAALGVPADRQGRGVAAQVGLALRVSPNRAQRYVGWATILTSELPQTFAALQAGRIGEWRALIVARETIWLSREDRAQVDTELAPRLESLGDAKLEAAAKKIAYRLDPTGFLARSRAAEKDRRVSLRPAPDCMTRLTALLPVKQGVAAYAALKQAADSTTAVGDVRGRGQIMADTLVERVTGQQHADDVPVEVHLVMTDRTLLAASDTDATEPGHLDGYGPIPAGLARELALDGTAPRWIRRLFTTPGTGQLVAMESRRRTFTRAQRLFLRLRDHTCRTPYCDAPDPPHRPHRPVRRRRADCDRQRPGLLRKPATTPNKPPAGTCNPSPPATGHTKSRSPHPPATPTAAAHPTHQAAPPDQTLKRNLDGPLRALGSMQKSPYLLG